MHSTVAPLLGVDVGTTSISVVVIDSISGRNLSTYTRHHNARLPVDGPGSYLQDPEILTTTTYGLIARAKEQYPNIAAVGITGQMHGLVILDDECRALSPAYTWLDRRLSWLSAGGASYQSLMKDEVGCDVPVGYAAGTLFVLGRLGLIPSGARFVVGIPDYIALRLTGGGRPVTSPGMAQSMGCYALGERQFRSDLWRMISPLSLPEVHEAAHIVGETPDGMLLATPEGDNQTSFVAGIRDPDRAISINVGTSGQVSVYDAAPAGGEAVERGPMERRPYPGGGTLLVGATLSGGKSFEMLASLIGDIATRIGSDGDDPYRLLADLPRPDGATALRVDTRFSGTRDDPSVRGAITDIAPDNMTLPHLYWGIADGVVTELAHLVTDHRRILDAPESYIGISGNAIKRSAALRTTLAERFARPLRTLIDAEAAARGAAMLAAAALAGGAEALPEIQKRMICYAEES